MTPPPGPRSGRHEVVAVRVLSTAAAAGAPGLPAPDPFRCVAVPTRVQELVGPEAARTTGRDVGDVLPGLDLDVLRTVARTGRPAHTAQAVVVRPEQADPDPDPDGALLLLLVPGAAPGPAPDPEPVGDDSAGDGAGPDPDDGVFPLAFVGAPTAMAVSSGGFVLRVNPALAGLLGRTPDELVGVPVAAVGGPSDPADPAGAADPDRRAGPCTEPGTLVHRSGRPVRVRASRVDLVLGRLRFGLWQVLDVTAELRELDALTRAAVRDEVTGLPNRTGVLAALESELADRGRRAPALLLVDLDGTGAVDDALGHEAGDRVLRQVAQRLRHAVRPEDTVGRSGDHELAVVCHDLRDGEPTDQLCRRLLHTVGEPVEVDGRPVTVGASIGVAHAGTASTGPSLAREADAARSAAKRAGRGRHVVGDELLQGFAGAALDEEAGFRSAVEHRTLGWRVVPVRRLSTLQLGAVAAEPVRRHPDRGPLDAAHCRAVAARTGLGRALGELALDEACARLAAWRTESGRDDLEVTVALSAEHLAHPDAPGDVRHALARSGVEASALVVEVPAQALVNAPDAVRRHLAQLDEAGVGLALGGFGAGWSSLDLLTLLPVRTVVLARSLVARAAGGGRGATLLRGIADVCASLGTAVRATGVDTADTLAAARAAGCTDGIGDLLGAAADTADWAPPAVDAPTGPEHPGAAVVRIGSRQGRRT